MRYYEAKREDTLNSPSKQSTPQTRPTLSNNSKGPPSPATPQGGQTLNGNPTRHTTEEHTDAAANIRGTRPPPINITLQDPKDTVTLIEKTLNIKHFHIKRIHTGKHVLYLQHPPDYNKAKEILFAANTAFYTYAPKSEKHHTYLLKGLGDSYTEAEILADLQALQIDDVHFTKVYAVYDEKIKGEHPFIPNLYNYLLPLLQSNTNNLLKINRFNYFRIKWEKVI